VPPRWLAGDWVRVVRDPVDLIRLGLLAGLLAVAVVGEWGHAARFAAGLGLSVLARAGEVPRPFDALFALAMSFQAWGALVGADAAAGYETVARAMTWMSVAALLYLLLVRVRAVPDLAGKSDIHERTGILLTATSLGFGVGMLYEIVVWATRDLLDAGATTFEELIAHMAIGFAASAVGAALLVVWDRAGWETRRVPAARLVRPA